MKFEKVFFIEESGNQEFKKEHHVLPEEEIVYLKKKQAKQEEQVAGLLLKQLGVNPTFIEGDTYLEKVVNYLTDSFHKDEAFLKKYEPKTIPERTDFFNELSKNCFSRNKDFFIKLFIAGLIEVEVPLLKYIPWKKDSPETKHLITLIIERENNE